LKAMPAKKKKGGKKKGGAKKEDDAPPPPPVVFSKRAYEDLELEARVPSFINAVHMLPLIIFPAAPFLVAQSTRHPRA